MYNACGGSIFLEGGVGCFQSLLESLQCKNCPNVQCSGARVHQTPVYQQLCKRNDCVEFCGP